jgi:glycosyltransferase involved in cell wall biosynthesis
LPVRVLHVFKSSYQHSMGGIENALRQMVHSSSALGVQNTILCIGNTILPEVSQNGTTRVLACRASVAYDSLCFSRSMFRRFKTLLREHDLVHYHFPFPQQDIMHLMLHPGVPSVLTYHSDIVRQRLLYRFYQPLLKRFLSRVDAIVATSENYLASSRVLNQFRDRVCVIPLGLDQDFYPEADQQVRKRWEAAVGRDFFLFIGVLRYYKGLDILLQAAMKTDERFVIAGIGPMQEYLRAKVEKLELRNVILLGGVSEPDKTALLRLCRALVFPSHLRSEAFGLTLVEGAMFGKPLISCDIGTGTSFINQHEKTGLVVRRADPEALLGAVRVLAENPQLADIYGVNARQRYLELFTARVQAQKYAGLYERLLSERLLGVSHKHREVKYS